MKGQAAGQQLLAVTVLSQLSRTSHTLHGDEPAGHVSPLLAGFWLGPTASGHMRDWSPEEGRSDLLLPVCSLSLTVMARPQISSPVVTVNS